jgi:CubicO group peptidase (beta-lactamase class C family)
MPAPIESAERIREVIRQVYSDDRQPGLAVSVVSRDGVVFEHAEGYADIESKQPMTLAHRHCIGSVTKTLVAVCVMALVDEGRLSLADKVTDLLPDVRFDGPAESMTVWHLLTHTSGIGEAPTVDALAAEVAASDNMRWRERDFSDAYPNGILVGAVPGTI